MTIRISVTASKYRERRCFLSGDAHTSSPPQRKRWTRLRVWCWRSLTTSTSSWDCDDHLWLKKARERVPILLLVLLRITAVVMFDEQMVAHGVKSLGL